MSSNDIRVLLILIICESLTIVNMLQLFFTQPFFRLHIEIKMLPRFYFLYFIYGYEGIKYV